jgi:hypothetical protein
MCRFIDARAAFERVSDQVLGRFVLMPDCRAGQKEAAQAAAPKRLRVGDRIGRGVLGDCHVDEPSSLQQPGELSRVGEAVYIVTLWQVRRHRYANLADGVAENALDSLARRIVPPGKCNASTGLQGPHTLCNSSFRPGKMSEPESADNRMEGIIRKREMFHVSFTKLNGGVQSPCQPYHLRRQVDTEGARATICGFGCKSTRPGRDVQQTRTRVQTHGIEKVVGGQGGHPREECMIARCQSIVTPAFEGAQSLRLAAGKFWWRHGHLPLDWPSRHRPTITALAARHITLSPLRAQCGVVAAKWSLPHAGPLNSLFAHRPLSR